MVATGIELKWSFRISFSDGPSTFYFGSPILRSGHFFESIFDRLKATCVIVTTLMYDNTANVTNIFDVNITNYVDVEEVKQKVKWDEVKEVGSNIVNKGSNILNELHEKVMMNDIPLTNFDLSVGDISDITGTSGWLSGSSSSGNMTYNSNDVF